MYSQIASLAKTLQKIIRVRLTQAPTSTVWIPLALSNGVSNFVSDEVFEFTPANWNQFQVIQLDPVLVGQFDIYLKPLHSDDPFYNGHNPEDLYNYTGQAADITNISNWEVAPCDTFEIILNVVNQTSTEGLDFRVLEGPSGLNVVEYSGRLTFRPLSNQIDSTYTVRIEVTDQEGNISIFETTLKVFSGSPCDPQGIFVDYQATDDPSVDGTVAHPFHSIVPAVLHASTNGGGNVYVRGVEHQMTSIITIPYEGPESNPIVIQPLPGEHVKLNFDLRAAFEFLNTAKNITLQGFEIDGGTDEVDFWCIVAQALYGDATIPRGGGIAVNIDGDSLTVKNNYIHDCYQKAVEIQSARYLDVTGNIIHHIATTSLSGGHGIMRQQKGDEIFEEDNLADYRWDINGNLIYNVEQRIYSWVPSKNYMEMTLDEGKPILIDDPKDSDDVMDVMKARIMNNIVAYGSIDHIRLKSTPNLEVLNNSVYTTSSHADGITDKVGDDATPQFINFVFENNAVQTLPGKQGFELTDAIYQATNNPGSTLTINNNYTAQGIILPANTSGLNQIATSQLYIDPNAGNFRLNPALSLPSNLGVDISIIEDLEQRAEDFGVTVKWDGWVNDDLKLTQTILDNIPGVYDDIAGNETVFTDFGAFNGDTTHIEFSVVNGQWKADFGITSNNHEFRLNEAYDEWMKDILSTYINASSQGYDRARWGCSYVKQDYTFENNWLVVSTIEADTNTVIYGIDVDFEIDGDLLVVFDGVTPTSGSYFDLIIAQNITSLNSGDIFDYVHFEGFTPNDYSITIVTLPDGNQAVRLTILNSNCNLVVTSTADNGANSLREAIACAIDGDTIRLNQVLEGDTIKLTSLPLVIDKSITILSDRQMIYLQNCVAPDISTMMGKTISLENFSILSDHFTNNATLLCKDMIFDGKDSQDNCNFVNNVGSSVQVVNSVRIE